MMDVMSTRSRIRASRRVRRVCLGALGLAGAFALTSCSGSPEPTAEAADVETEEPSRSEPPTTTTIPPTTTTAPTTSTSTSSTSTSTSTTTSTTTTEPIVVPALPTTTIVVDLPDEPIAPPNDSYAQEPIIEVGSIAIPKLGVDMAMYEGIRLTTLDYGPGHWPGSAMPGQVGNVVVGGHRTSSHRVFRDVDQLVAGDEIVFRDGNGVHRYQVNRVEIVPPTAVWIVEPTETATATLFACHPPGSTAQRIVVFADFVDSTTA
jgi:sortase A